MALEDLLSPIAQTRGEALAGTRIWDGVIAETATAEDQLLYVRLPGADDEQYLHGPCPWMPRGAAMPKAGDRCLVAIDDDGEQWIIAWIPDESS